MTREILFEIVPGVKEAAPGLELAPVEVNPQVSRINAAKKTQRKTAGLLDSDSHPGAGLAVQGDAHQNVLPWGQIARQQNRHLAYSRNSRN